MPKLILCLLLAAGTMVPSHAQTIKAPTPELSDTIVVQGIRNPSEEIGRFVNALTETPLSGQLSRFDRAVCPVVVGLGDARGATIARRMRQVADAAAIPVDNPGCKPNVLLFVTRDKGDLISQLYRKYPNYFDGVQRSDVKRMISDPSPAAAWHVEGRIDADGIAVQRDRISGREIIERTDTASRLSTASRPHFLASIVVVDLDALGGLSLTQLADYAAMRTFGRTDPSRAARSSAPSILSVVEASMDSPVPLTLTKWDLAFLKSLYASDANRSASRQRSEMTRIVGQKLQDERKDGD